MELGKELIVKIIRYNNEGEGVAIFNDLVIFIPGVIIDEEVKIKIVELKKNYARGEVIKLLIPSTDRRIPVCPFYNECGSCNLMHIDYNKQLEFKKKKVEDVFKKVSNIDVEVKKINSYNNLHYRNKVVLRVNKDKIGYYKPKTNTLVDINECLICDELINEIIRRIRSFIKDNNNHKIKEVMIRVAREEIIISFDDLNKKYIDTIKELFKDVTSLYIKDELIFGIPSINQKLLDLVFDISPKSFFQINTLTASKLFEYALKDVNDRNICVDLYSGTGTITMLLSKKARRVIGIEVVPDAVKDAENNLLLNDIDNVEFKLGRVEDLIDELKDINIDTLVMDPPRSGSDKRSLRALLKIKPKEIIYISCNPITLARDYNVIKNLYKIKEIELFDMFPNTYHVETVMVLERR